MKKLALLVLLVPALMLVGCTKAPETATTTAPTFKIGFVTDTGGIDDKSFNQGTWEGVVKFGQEKNLVKDKDYKYLQSTAEADYVPNLSAFADEKMDLIIAAGFLFNKAMADTATKFADRKFLIIDSVVTVADKDKDGKDIAGTEKNVPNVANAVFAEQEGSFLVGVAAGLKAKADGKKVVGFIGGMKFALIEKFEAGFKAGVKAVFPECKILVDYAGDFAAPDKGQALAQKQFNAGAYVIYHAAGGTGNGMIKEAKERTSKGDVRWAIGVDKDQYADGVYADGKSVVLTSMMKRVDTAAHDVAAMTMDGKFPGGQVLVFNVANGGISLPANNPNLSADILAKVAEFSEKIKSGSLVVPEKP
jgi:basic membrane protein A and related proteins